MIAGVCGGEGEFGGLVFVEGRFLGYHAVVVVEGLVDCDGDLEVWCDAEGAGGGVVGFGFVAS